MIEKFACYPGLSVINFYLHIRKPGAIVKENRQMRTGLFTTADIAHICLPQKAKMQLLLVFVGGNLGMAPYIVIRLKGIHSGRLL